MLNLQTAAQPIDQFPVLTRADPNWPSYATKMQVREAPDDQRVGIDESFSCKPSTVERIGKHIHNAAARQAASQGSVDEVRPLIRRSGFQRGKRHLKVLRFPFVVVVEERDISRARTPDADIQDDAKDCCIYPQ